MTSLSFSTPYADYRNPTRISLEVKELTSEDQKQEAREVLLSWQERMEVIPTANITPQIKDCSDVVGALITKIQEAATRTFVAYDEKGSPQGMMTTSWIATDEKGDFEKIKALSSLNGRAFYLEVSLMSTHPENILFPESRKKGITSASFLIATAARVALDIGSEGVVIPSAHTSSRFYEELGFSRSLGRELVLPQIGCLQLLAQSFSW